MRFSTGHVGALALLMMTASSCGGARPSSSSATLTQATWNPASVPGPDGRAHRLAIEATACWMGRLWRDAMREEDATRPDEHCRTLLDETYGEHDAIRLERLRALDVVEIAELEDRILMVAKTDPLDGPRARELRRFLSAVADAQREQMRARRAASRIKKDISGERTPGKRLDDERDAVEPLSEGRDMFALLAYSEEPFAAEAHTIGLFCALDRMNMANGLPKHLKVYALERAFAGVFSVSAPAVPSDATVPMKAGSWLAYLSATAIAAGHPVSPNVTALEAREMLAWTGVLAGFADRLRAEAAHMSDETALKTAAVGASRRLDVERREAEAAVLARPPQ